MTGNFVWSGVDLEGPSPVLQVKRFYNSFSEEDLGWGPGWVTPYTDRLIDGEDDDVVLVLDDGRGVTFPSDGAGGWNEPHQMEAELLDGGSGTHKVVFRDETEWLFDSDGLLVSKLDWAGVGFTITRDGSDRVSVVTATAGGSTLTFTWGTGGYLEGIASSDGRSVSYSVTAGELLEFVDAEGAEWEMTYDAVHGNLESLVGPPRDLAETPPVKVVEFFNYYDDFARVEQQDLPSGEYALFDYDDLARKTVVTAMPADEDTIYRYDSLGRVTEIEDVNTNKLTKAWTESDSQLAETTDRSGAKIEPTYDGMENGRLSSFDTPGVGTSNIEYDSSDRITKLTDPQSGDTLFRYSKLDGSDPYDESSRIPREIEDELGNVATQQVVNGLVTEIIDPDGVKTTMTYDASRRVKTVTDGESNETEYDYTPEGWLKWVETPEGRRTEYTYDDEGRVLTMTAPGNDPAVPGTKAVTVYVYDDAGRLTSMEDPTDAVTTYTYDDVTGLLKTEAVPGQAATTYEYDDYGNLKKVVELPDPDGAGPLTAVESEYSYGVLNRLQWEHDQEDRHTGYEYDESGRVTKVTAPDGGTVEYDYHPDGRIDEVVQTVKTAGLADDVRTTEYAYESDGLVDRIYHADHDPPLNPRFTDYEYDDMGRQIAVTDPSGVTTHTSYTDGGRVDRVWIAATASTPKIETIYGLDDNDVSGYDDAGRQVRVIDPNGGETLTEYWPDGQVKKVTSPEGIDTSYTYDPAGRVRTVTDDAGVVATTTYTLRGEVETEQTTDLGMVEYSYNGDGTLEWVDDALDNRTEFTYDNLGRLISRENADGDVDSWEYDRSGFVTKRLFPTVTSGTQPLPVVYAPDAAGRVGTITDGSGRITTNVWNTAGELVKATYSDGVTSFDVTSVFDKMGRRKTATDPSGVESWNYDKAGRMLSHTTPGDRTTMYEYDAIGRQSAMRTPRGDWFDYTLDVLGRTTEVTPRYALSDTFTGADGITVDPSNWTEDHLGSGATSLIDTNTAKLGFATSGTSTARMVSNTVPTANTEIAFRYDLSTDDTDGVFQLHTRADSGDSYRIQLEKSATIVDTVALYKYDDSTSTETLLDDYNFGTGGGWKGLRFSVNGSALKVRHWDIGTDEPSTWAIEVTDTDLVAAGDTYLQWDRNTEDDLHTLQLDELQILDPTAAQDPAAEFGYDDDGRLESETFRDGTRTWDYTNGRLTQMDQQNGSGGITYDLDYNTSGLQDEITVDYGAASITTIATYDQAAQIKKTAPGTFTPTEWSYDTLGRRSERKVGTDIDTYNYNEASQLTTITRSGGDPTTTFTYDAAGRRTAESIATTPSATASSYSYDEAGRLIDRTDDTVTESRGYTPSGLFSTFETTTPYGIDVALDWDTNRAVSAPISSDVTGVARVSNTMLTGPRGRSVISNADEHSGLAGDHQNSTTDPRTGSAEFYDAYGYPAQGAEGILSFGYRGELAVAGLLHLRNREYDAETGQFTTIDPLEGVNGTPTVANPYHYADNNPIHKTDPLGLRSESAYDLQRPCPYSPREGANIDVQCRFDDNGNLEWVQLYEYDTGCVSRMENGPWERWGCTSTGYDRWNPTPVYPSSITPSDGYTEHVGPVEYSPGCGNPTSGTQSSTVGTCQQQPLNTNSNQIRECPAVLRQFVELLGWGGFARSGYYLLSGEEKRAAAELATSLAVGELQNQAVHAAIVKFGTKWLVRVSIAGGVAATAVDATCTIRG